MKYPKALMSITELVELGYSRTDLIRAAHHKLRDKYIIPTAGGGKFRFDTEAWEKYRKYVLGRD